MRHAQVDAIVRRATACMRKRFPSLVGLWALLERALVLLKTAVEAAKSRRRRSGTDPRVDFAYNYAR